MPRANPNASFEIAAKHLFRHLHDPKALRENPLTSGLFEGADSPSAMRVADRAGLERIHTLVRTAAGLLRNADDEAGKSERARRQYAIAVEDFLQGGAVATIAADLGISTTQYYRERSHVCARIAKHIDNLGQRVCDAAVTPFDEFRFGMTRAAGLAELGDTDRALLEYDRFVRTVDSAARKIEALCESALVYLGREAVDDAGQSLRQARTMLARSTGLSPRERCIAEAHVAYVRGMLQWITDPSGARDLFAVALSHFDDAGVRADGHAGELYARILFEYGESLTTFHQVGASVETMSRAGRTLASCRDASAAFALRIEIGVRTFRNAMLVDPFGWESLRERLETMRELGRRARLTGSVDLNLRALNGIAQLEASSGDAAAALHSAQSALALSKYAPNRELFSEVGVRIARTVMYTPLWGEVPKLLRGAGPAATAAVATARRTLEAEYALRRGLYAKARAMMRGPDMLARPFMAMLAAQAEHGLGRQREALALVESAVPAIEKSGIALTIERTYRIAAHITNDARMTRRADEIERALSA